MLAMLDPAAGTDVVPIAAISGMAGMGKTELAKQVGHVAVARGWFPGGVIFLDMHGYDPGREPVTASAAVDQALRALGVAADEIPPTQRSSTNEPPFTGPNWPPRWDPCLWWRTTPGMPHRSNRCALGLPGLAPGGTG